MIKGSIICGGCRQIEREEADDRFERFLRAHHFQTGALVCDCGAERKYGAGNYAPPGWPGPQPEVVECAEPRGV